MMTTVRTTPPAPRFTPGPWFEHSHRQIGPDAGIVCEVWSAIGWGDAAIAEADANCLLIAAAPELYTALLTALVVVAGCNADGYFDEQEREIRAALALADGRITPTSISLATISGDSEGGEA